MSAADHQHLCLRQFHFALTAQHERRTQNGTGQKYVTTNFSVAAAKKQLLLRLRYIVKNYAVYTAFVARVFKFVHALENALAQKEMVETHSDAASDISIGREKPGGGTMTTAGVEPTVQATAFTMTKGETVLASSSEFVLSFSSVGETTCSEVELDKLGRDCQATVELDTRILECLKALKDQGWFSDETQGVTVQENPVAKASITGT